MFNHFSVALSTYNKYKLPVKMCLSHLSANHVNNLGKRVSLLFTETIFSQFRNAFRGVSFTKLRNLFLVFHMKNTIEKYVCMMHSYTLRELQSICTDRFLGNLYLRKTWGFILFGGIGRHLKSRNKEKKCNCVSPITLRVCSKGLNSITVKEKWTLFRWRLKCRNAILSNMSIIIELWSHRGQSVLYQVLTKILL